METKVSRWWDSKRVPEPRTIRTLLHLLKSWGWTLKEVEKWENFDLLNLLLLGQALLQRDRWDYHFLGIGILKGVVFDR